MGRITYRIEADKQKAVDAFLAILDKQKQVADGAKKLTRETENTGKATDKHKASLDGVLSSFVGINSAAQLIGKAITEINAGMERFDELAKGAKSDFASEKSIRKKLGTIAKGDQKRFDQLNDLTREIAEREGISFAQAGESVFSGTSSGFSPDEIRSITKLNRISDDPKFAFETVKSFKSLFGDEAGDAGQILNKVLAASADSPVSFEQFGGAAARAAGSFRQLGGSDEELLAGLSVIAEGNPAALEQQTTQLDALTRQLAKDDQFKGLGFIGSLEKLQGLVKGGGSLQDILKESNAVKGGSLALQNLSEIKNRLGKIEEAEKLSVTDKSQISLATRVLEDSPEGSIQRRADQAREQAKGANRLQGVRETAEQAILDKSRAEIFGQLNSGQITPKVADFRLEELKKLDIDNLQDLSKVGEAAVKTVSGFGAQIKGNTPEQDAVESRLLASFTKIIEKFEQSAENLKAATLAAKEERERQNRQNPDSHNEGT